MNVGELWVRIGARMDGLSKGLAEAETQTKTAAKRFEGFQAAGERLSGIGQSLTAGVTLPLVGVALAASNTAMTFNASMADVATLIPGNTQRVEELKTAVQDMAVETGKRTADLSRGLYQVVSAFGDTADTATILETNARAAAAGLATTEQAIALTSAVTKGYGDTSAEAVAKASDLALLTVRLGQTTFPELAGSIGRVTPLASAMGVSMEDLFATMATLTGVTGSAAEVSTQLRGVLQGLMDPSEAMGLQLQKLGYSSGTAALESLGLQGVLQGLATQTGGNKEQLAGLFGSIEAGTAVLALTGGQADAFNQRLQDMQGYAGATDIAFKAQTEGVNKTGFAWQQMRSQLEVTAQRIGDLLAPALTQLVEHISSLVTWFSNLDEGQQKTILTIAGIAAAIGPLLMGLGFLFGAVAKVSAGITALKVFLFGTGAVAGGAAAKVGILSKTLIALKAVLAGAKVVFLAVTAKVWLIIAAVALLAAGVYLLIKNWDEVKAFFADLWENVTATFRRASSTVQTVIQGMWDFATERFHSMVDRVRSVMSGVVDAIASPFRDAWGQVSAIANNIREALNSINPFARFSPSLVDNVRAGVRVIQAEYAKLGQLQLPQVSEMVAGLSPRALTPALATSNAYYGGNTVHVQISGVANASDMADKLLRELQKRGVRL